MGTADIEYFDAHVHLGWFANAAAVARDAAKRGLGMLAVTVTPEEYPGVCRNSAAQSNVMPAAGLHPWWVRSPEDADALCELLPNVRFVGEIGLDASPRHEATWDAQLAALVKICAACAQTSDPTAPKVLSIHAVRSASPVLDVLERTGAASSCRCVLHWFSGSSEELWRAVHLGCRFSLGERSLQTRRGREYARILPVERLLTETDLPKGERSPATADDILDSLTRAIEGIAAARNTPAEAVRLEIAANAAELLG